MKLFILILSALALAVPPTYADGNPSTEQIRRLAASGEVCKAIGHRWEKDIYSDSKHNYSYCRRCLICGERQIERTVWVTIPAETKENDK